MKYGYAKGPGDKRNTWLPLRLAIKRGEIRSKARVTSPHACTGVLCPLCDLFIRFGKDPGVGL